jgi:transcriptional antiterminator RfaH
MTSDNRWYVVHTHPQHESRADVNLRRQGFTTYFPCYLRTRRHARRTDAVTRALFPRYLFVNMDIARDRWRAIQSTYGVSSLVAAGDEPLPVPTEIVEEIRGREDAEGFVTIGLAAGLRLGSRIRLVDGLFADASGTIERIAGERRVAVLLQLLGREVRVSVPAALVAPA